MSSMLIYVLIFRGDGIPCHGLAAASTLSLLQYYSTRPPALLPLPTYVLVPSASSSPSRIEMHAAARPQDLPHRWGSDDLSPSLMSSGSLLVTTYLRGRLPYAASCLFFASRPGQCQVLPQELRRTISLLVQCHSLQAAGRYYRLILYLQSPACCLHPSRLFVCRASSPQHASLHHPLFHSADAMAIHDIPIIISYCF